MSTYVLLAATSQELTQICNHTEIGLTFEFRKRDKRDRGQRERAHGTNQMGQKETSILHEPIDVSHRISKLTLSDVVVVSVCWSRVAMQIKSIRLGLCMCALCIKHTHTHTQTPEFPLLFV